MAALSMTCLHAAAGRGFNRNLNIRGPLINRSTLPENRSEPEVSVNLSLVVYKLRKKSQLKYGVKRLL
jgi:hypothetical protein